MMEAGRVRAVAMVATVAAWAVKVQTADAAVAAAETVETAAAAVWVAQVVGKADKAEAPVMAGGADRPTEAGAAAKVAPVARAGVW